MAQYYHILYSLRCSEPHSRIASACTVTPRGAGLLPSENTDKAPRSPMTASLSDVHSEDTCPGTRVLSPLQRRSFCAPRLATPIGRTAPGRAVVTSFLGCRPPALAHLSQRMMKLSACSNLFGRDLIVHMEVRDET